MWLDLQSPLSSPLAGAQALWKKGPLSCSWSPSRSPEQLPDSIWGPQSCWPFLELAWEILTLLGWADAVEEEGRVLVFVR